MLLLLLSGAGTAETVVVSIVSPTSVTQYTDGRTDVAGADGQTSLTGDDGETVSGN